MTEYGRKHTDGSRSGGQPITKTQHCPNCEATEQKLHDFRQEVSDAVEEYKADQPHIWKQSASGYFSRFIIPAPKPDPLVEAIKEASQMAYLGDEHLADNYRKAIEKRGGKIVWGDE